MSADPTTVSIETRNDELKQLRAETLRLSTALVAAHAEVEVLRADRDRLAGSGNMAGGSTITSSGWSELISQLNALRKRLDAKPRELRVGYALHPGSLLNAYREGDLSFDEACDVLDSVEFSEACAALRRSCCAEPQGVAATAARLEFSCGSIALGTPRDWALLIGELVGDDGDSVEVASTVVHGPHLLQKWDIRGTDHLRAAEVGTLVERALRKYTEHWAPGFYRCLVIRAQSDVQLLRSRVISVAVTSPGEGC